MLEPQRSADRSKATGALFVAVCVAFAAASFFGQGSPWDEGEHLHVAWMIAHLGLHPVHDFFEHHTPLLWYVLGLIFRAGSNGPEALYCPRLFVRACAAIWCVVLARLTRQWSRYADPQNPSRIPGAIAISGFLVFAIV